jgi:prevent-host-death family protein
MKTVTHRELRNNSGAVLRDVAAGETVAVTNRGEVVAHLSPAGEKPGLAIARPATRRIDVSRLAQVTIDRPSAEVLEDVRGER